MARDCDLYAKDMEVVEIPGLTPRRVPFQNLQNPNHF
jgi:hypothetical protein